MINKGVYMMKYICLRDDDTSFNTRYSELEDAYETILGRYPITLATIPFVHGSERKIIDYDLDKNKFQRLYEWEISASRQELDKYHETHPIGNNKDLISKLSQLIKDNYVEIALHGVTHKYNNRGAEMFCDSVSIYDIEEAKLYLEKCFDVKIRTFIPPSNTIDLSSALNVNRLGMILFSSGTPKADTMFKKIRMCLRDISPILEKKSDYLRNSPLKTRNGLDVFGSFTFFDSSEYNSFLDRLNKNLETYGFCAIGTHYWFLNSNKEKKDEYIRIIKTLSAQPDTVFVTANEYYELLCKSRKRLRRFKL